MIILGDPIQTVCSSKDRKCIESVEDDMNTKLEVCDCFPSCNLVEYELKLYKEKW